MIWAMGSDVTASAGLPFMAKMAWSAIGGCDFWGRLGNAAESDWMLRVPTEARGGTRRWSTMRSAGMLCD